MSCYLVTVQCILRGTGGQGDGVWLTAAFTLTVQVLSISAQRNTQHMTIYNPTTANCYILKRRCKPAETQLEAIKV